MKRLSIINLILLLFTAFGFSQSTASPQVSQFTIKAPQLVAEKTIWLYLPDSYQDSQSKYPVMYMFDAQNLFDAEASFVGEWEIDEYLDKTSSQEVIIVAIEHGNEKRIEELTPFPHSEYGGGQGDAFLDFMVNTLKPYMDQNYRTKPDRKHTAIMGSSLGGLMAFYGVLKFPDIFGRAGVFSPAFWVNPEIFDLTQNTTWSSDASLYFMAGTNESETMIAHIEQMIGILRSKGLSETHFQLRTVEGGTHNESLWKEQFPEAFEWLFSKH